MKISKINLYSMKLSTEIADAAQTSSYVDMQISGQQDEWIQENDQTGFLSSSVYALDADGNKIRVSISELSTVGGISNPLSILPGEVKYSVEAIVSSGQSIGYVYDQDMNLISTLDTCPENQKQYVAIGREYDFSNIVEDQALSSARYVVFNSYMPYNPNIGVRFPFVRKFAVNNNYRLFDGIKFVEDSSISFVSKVLYDQGNVVREIGTGKRTNFIPLTLDDCCFMFSTSVCDHARPFYLFKDLNLSSCVCIDASNKNRNGTAGVGCRITNQKVSFKEQYVKYGARYVVFNYYPGRANTDKFVPVFEVKKGIQNYIDQVVQKTDEAEKLLLETTKSIQYTKSETFTSADMINGKCLIFNGAPNPVLYSAGAMSYLFPIDPSQVSYDVSSYICDSTRAIVIYDQDFNVVSAYGKGDSEGVPKFIELSNETFNDLVKTIPTAKYVRFCRYSAGQAIGNGYPIVVKKHIVNSTESICRQIEHRVDEAMQRQDPLWKKTYVTFGDSFTNISLPRYVDRFGLSGIESDAYDRKWKHYKTYPVHIANRHEMNWIECGASGSRTFSPIWPEYPDNITYLTKEIFKPAKLSAISAADYLTFAYGINDIISASPSAEIETRSRKVYYYQGTYPNYTANDILSVYGGAMTDFIPINPNATYSISSVYTGSVSPINVFTDAVLSSRLPVFDMRPYNGQERTIVSTLNFGDLYTLSGARYVMFCAYKTSSSLVVPDDFKVVMNASNSIGEISSCRMNTFCGAWNNVLSAVLSVNPSIKTGIIINDSRMDQHFHDAMLSVGRYWGIPVLDLKSDPNIPLMTYGVGGTPGKYGIQMNPYALDQRRKVFNYTYNDIHPSLFAHEYRSWIIENFMKTL